MKTPNIFDFETYEAEHTFFAWLISWADKSYESEDCFLNKCATTFLKDLMGVPESYVIESVDCKKEWNNIAISVLVNKNIFIALELRNGTKEGFDQLYSYAKIARYYHKNPKMEIKLVYCGMEEHGQYHSIEKAGFCIFTRARMLTILRNYTKETRIDKQNHIILDYKKILTRKDEDIRSFFKLPLNDWWWYSWQGFYSNLQEHLGGNWKYVHGTSRGFLRFWWNTEQSDNSQVLFEPYIQLEEKELVFKLYVNKKEGRQEIYDIYRNRLFVKAKDLDIDITPCSGEKNYGSIAKLNSEYRVLNDSGLIDFPATVENLKRISLIIKNTPKELRPVPHRTFIKTRYSQAI